MTTFETVSPSTIPPRPRCDLTRIPISVPRKTQLETVTFRTPPDISLPIVTPPCPLYITQLVIVISSEALPILRPSSLVPDLIAMQSSPTSIRQLEICTFLQASGLMPSVLGDGTGASIVTPSTRTLSHSRKCKFQDGEFR